MDLTLSSLASNPIATDGWRAVAISQTRSSDSIQKMCRVIAHSW